jgi:hypothetical protein
VTSRSQDMCFKALGIKRPIAATGKRYAVHGKSNYKTCRSVDDTMIAGKGIATACCPITPPEQPTQLLPPGTPYPLGCSRKGEDGKCYAGTSGGSDFEPRTWSEAEFFCRTHGLALCEAPANKPLCAGEGCAYDHVYAWTSEVC